MPVTRRLQLGALAVAVAVVSGCDGSPTAPAIAPAKTYRLAGFHPAGTVRVGVPTAISLEILRPSGTAITRYRRGAGPHTGIHLLVVPNDLRTMTFEAPRVATDGSIRQPITFSAPGVYHVVVDAFPAEAGVPPNLQLFATIRAVGRRRASRVASGLAGYRFALAGAGSLRSLVPSRLTVEVTTSRGTPVTFSPFLGALAHAIFFREGRFAYFHTHVCAPGQAACASAVRGAGGGVGRAGTVTFGVLLPLPGIWRMFLWLEANGRELLAPFTLHVR